MQHQEHWSGVRKQKGKAHKLKAKLNEKAKMMAKLWREILKLQIRYTGNKWEVGEIRTFSQWNNNKIVALNEQKLVQAIS